MGDKKIKFGVIGVGYLGEYHLKHLLDIKNVHVIGIYDTNKIRANNISKQYDVSNYKSEKHLLEIVDAVSIVTPTITHIKIALQALKYDCHIFIEKPISDTTKSANEFLKKIQEKNKVVHIGHIERFNPAFQAFIQNPHIPLFLECHRLTKVNNRSMDISVILDLMIHDIDLLLHLIESPIKEIIADGVNVISDNIDLANVKLIFKNGCVANLTASRISNKDMRKIRVFERHSYTNIDLLNKKLTKYDAKYSKEDKKLLFNTNTITVQKYDSLKMELTHFCQSIIDNETNLKNISQAVEALTIAEQINQIIKNKIK